MRPPAALSTLPEGLTQEVYAPMPDEKISPRDEALFWLNSHLGEPVNVTIAIDRGGYNQEILSASGEVRHWRQGEEADEVAGLDPSGLREDIIGLYRIGDSMLDLSDIPAEAATRNWITPETAEALDADPSRGLVLEIWDEITLTMVAPLPDIEGGER